MQMNQLSTPDATVNTNSTFEDYIRLYDQLVDRIPSHARPVKNQSDKLNVSVGFYLDDLLGVNELDQTIETLVWVNFSWKDELRKWNISDYGGIDIVYPRPEDIWHPKLILHNSVEKRVVFDREYAPTILLNNGTVMWEPGAAVITRCTLDFTYFPFDEQTCELDFIGVISNKYLRFVEVRENLVSSHYKTGGEWDLGKITFIPDPFSFLHEHAPATFVIQISLDRRPYSFIVNTLMPVKIVSLMAALVFVLPADSGERASFATSLLLSLSMFMSTITAQLPQKSNKFPLIITYIFELLLLTSFGVTTTVFQMMWISRKSLKGKASDQQNADSFNKGNKVEDENKDLASRESRAFNTKETSKKSSVSEQEVSEASDNKERFYSRTNPVLFCVYVITWVCITTWYWCSIMYS